MRGKDRGKWGNWDWGIGCWEAGYGKRSIFRKEVNYSFCKSIFYE
jgi:hypothetical protein